jgi:predicted transcriptional regulator
VRREQRGGGPAEANGHIPEQAASAPEQATGRRAAGALEQAAGRRAAGAPEQATGRHAAGALEQAAGRQAAGALEQAAGRQAAGALEQAAGRRAAGALESEILGVLWNAQGALSPGEVRESLARTDAEGAALSYSTVVTILTRLHEKGSLSRERDGRAYRYAPVADEAGLAARRLSQLLDRSADREAVLSRFVADLSVRDEELLRSLLGAEDELDGTSRERR